ncbi:MAG: thioesterase, partial [Xanthomonas perforans]|nr:thioesterase [Xanthomonas perforans]
MTSTTPDPLSGLDWVKKRGMGALAEKMGFEWVEFTIDRCVATMPVEGNTQPVG